MFSIFLGTKSTFVSAHPCYPKQLWGSVVFNFWSSFVKYSVSAGNSKRFDQYNSARVPIIYKGENFQNSQSAKKPNPKTQSNKYLCYVTSNISLSSAPRQQTRIRYLIANIDATPMNKKKGLTFWHRAGRQQEVNARRSRPVSHDGHVGWITAKHGNVLLEPMEGGYLVHQAIVGRWSEVRIGVGVEKPWKKNQIM